MRKMKPALLALCATLLWVGAAEAQRYVDNGDGTVTDNTTHLMWEKKTTDGSVHDVNNVYSWSATETKPDGMAFVGFLGTLNHNSSDPNTGNTIATCFANHCDWRLPTSAELIGIFDRTAPGCNAGGFCIDPAFGPTSIHPCWSSTSQVSNVWYAWAVSLHDGFVQQGHDAAYPVPGLKAVLVCQGRTAGLPEPAAFCQRPVRAVRGGL
jgi:Protein of unknown function (DUF1566)